MCSNRSGVTCSAEYKGDAWHLLTAGLAGGKGIPASVAAHPCTFATLTAPSFGPVHGIRRKGPCRARRDAPVCAHGRPLWCRKRHCDDDPQVGQPLCWECYDYTAHVLWQWHAPELWRRFTIALQRDLAKKSGLPVSRFRKVCKIAYSKVVEYQARGAIHFHVPIRLDGPDGPDGPAVDLALDTGDLEDAVRAAAAQVRLDTPPLSDGAVYRLHWGAQVDTRSITDTAHRDSDRHAVVVHPEQVAAYLAKYLTKTTEEFGLSARVKSPIQARAIGASPHAVRLIETAAWLADQDESFARMRDNLTTLGYRGHPITKSRVYSVTFGQLRRVRRRFRSKPPGWPPTPTSAKSSMTTTSPTASKSSPPSSTSAAATPAFPPPQQRSDQPPTHAPDDVHCCRTNQLDREGELQMEAQKNGLGTPLQELWTIHQVSAFLHVPVGTLYQWRHKGVGPNAYRAGKRLLYDAAEVRR